MSKNKSWLKSRKILKFYFRLCYLININLVFMCSVYWEINRHIGASLVSFWPLNLPKPKSSSISYFFCFFFLIHRCTYLLCSHLESSQLGSLPLSWIRIGLSVAPGRISRALSCDPSLRSCSGSSSLLCGICRTLSDSIRRKVAAVFVCR